MSSKAHNKRRNAGLLYEFLFRAASTAIVDGDHDKSAAALAIIKKYFNKDAELYREYRLFNSLMKVEVKSEAVASTILREAALAAKSLQTEAVQKKKTALINEINKTFDDPTFWDAPIANYKIYATIGTLISEWSEQSGKVDIQRLAELEDRLVTWLRENKSAAQETEPTKRDGTERLALRLALRKFNEKYAGTLQTEQKDIIRLWALSHQSGKAEPVTKFLAEVKSSTLAAIDVAVKDPELSLLHEGIKSTREKIESEKLEEVNDETVTRFVLYSHLKSELTKRGDT